MLRLVVVAASVVMCSCNPVIGYGSIVAVDEELPLSDALYIWERHWGENPYSDDGPVVVTVSYGPLPDGLIGYATRRFSIPRNVCEISILRGLDRELEVYALAHEIGHCLGFDHDVDDPGSLMHPTVGIWQELREHHR